MSNQVEAERESAVGGDGFVYMLAEVAYLKTGGRSADVV